MGDIVGVLLAAAGGILAAVFLLIRVFGAGKQSGKAEVESEVYRKENEVRQDYAERVKKAQDARDAASNPAGGNADSERLREDDGFRRD